MTHYSTVYLCLLIAFFTLPQNTNDQTHRGAVVTAHFIHTTPHACMKCRSVNCAFNQNRFPPHPRLRKCHMPTAILVLSIGWCLCFRADPIRACHAIEIMPLNRVSSIGRPPQHIETPPPRNTRSSRLGLRRFWVGTRKYPFKVLCVVVGADILNICDKYFTSQNAHKLLQTRVAFSARAFLDDVARSTGAVL